MILRSYLLKAVKKLYPRIGLRASDVLLASYPKSGNTWFRFIWANIIGLEEFGGREIDFHTLNNELDAVYDTVSYGSVDFDCLPRLVKTHYEYDQRAFGRNRAVYLYRHPGDVLVSYHSYLSARKDGPVEGLNLSEFIRHEDYGLPAWCRHVRSWTDEADVLISYRQLKQDAAAVTKRVLRTLELPEFPDPVVQESVKRSSFGTLRDLEEDRGRPRTDDFSDDYRFIRSGSVGEWRERFEAGDITYLRSRLSAEGLDPVLDGP